MYVYVHMEIHTNTHMRAHICLFFFCISDPHINVYLVLLASLSLQFQEMLCCPKQSGGTVQMISDSKHTRKTSTGEIFSNMFFCHIHASSIILTKVVLTGIKFFTENTQVFIVTVTEKCCLEQKKKKNSILLYNEISKLLFKACSWLCKILLKESIIMANNQIRLRSKTEKGEDKK